MLPNPPALMDASERKLYTLLVLQELGCGTHLQLLYFMVDNGIMSYFDLALALGDLVDEGLAAKVVKLNDCQYQITEAGREALSFFINRLPHSKCEKIREAAPAWRERFARERQFAGSVSQNPGGEYVAHLELRDGDSTALSLDIPAPERRLAERLVQAWPECGEAVYRHLMNALAEAQEKL